MSNALKSKYSVYSRVTGEGEGTTVIGVQKAGQIVSELIDLEL